MRIVEFVVLMVAAMAVVAWLLGRPHTLASVRRPPGHVDPAGSWDSSPGLFPGADAGTPAAALSEERAAADCSVDASADGASGDACDGGGTGD